MANPYPLNIKHINELLQLSTLTLATIGLDGQPHATPVYFVGMGESGLHFYFFSDPASQHARDLERCPQAGVAIYPECSAWQDIRGLQMHGTVRSVSAGAEWEYAWMVYQAKFPFVSAFREVVAGNTLYTFEPRWLRLLDNRHGFGYKEEWSIP